MKNQQELVVTTVVLMLAVTACQAPAPQGSAESESLDYEAMLSPGLDAYISMWNTKDNSLLDRTMTEDYQREAPDQDSARLAEMKEFARQANEAYPDFHITVEETAYKENSAFLLRRATGTNSGGSVPATGKQIDVLGITLLRFRDGKIAEEIVRFDAAALQAQLGVTGIPHAE